MRRLSKLAAPGKGEAACRHITSGHGQTSGRLIEKTYEHPVTRKPYKGFWTPRKEAS